MTSLPGLVDNAGCGVPGCRGYGVLGSMEKTGSRGLVCKRLGPRVC